MKKEKPLLTISLLISNRLDTIPRCLDSLKMITDQIPSELILIDTSKNEEIHELLLKYTDKVYEFEWCQDFAKARNEGVKRAKGEWFLYLDDDEWFVEVEEILKFFQSGKYKNYGSVNIKVRNFTNTEYTEYTDGWVTRLFRLDGTVKFVGRVHEYLYPLRGEQIFLQAIANHSGYIYETEEKRRQHFERNAQLLLKLVEEEPDELRWQAQMVQEYCTIKDWEAIVDFCKKHLDTVKEITNFMDRNHFCTMYAGLLYALVNLNKHEEFQALCEQVEKDERSTDLLKDFMHFRKAENYMKLEEWDAVEKSIETYLKDYKKFKQNEEAMQEQMGALVIHYTFEKDYLDRAHNMLVYSELKKGNTGVLENCENDLELDKTDVPFNMRFISHLVELMGTTEYKSFFGNFASSSLLDEDLCTIMCAEAQNWEEKDDAVFRKIAHIYAQTDAKFWYVCYCRVIDADTKKDKTAVEAAVEELLNSLANVFFLPDKVYDIIDKYQIKIALLWDKIVASKWQETMQHFVMNCAEANIQKAHDLLMEVYTADDWRVMSLELAIMEKQIMFGPQMQVLEYYDLLKDYAQMKLVFYNAYCSEAGEQENIPLEVQAAEKINAYISLEAQDKKMALKCLKEAVDIYPPFAKGISNFLNLYSELENQRQQKQKKEMQTLRNQVIEQVQIMLVNGQVQTALQIVGQLKQMFPKDLEVVKLALEVRLKTLE